MNRALWTASLLLLALPLASILPSARIVQALTLEGAPEDLLAPQPKAHPKAAAPFPPTESKAIAAKASDADLYLDCEFHVSVDDNYTGGSFSKSENESYKVDFRNKTVTFLDANDVSPAHITTASIGFQRRGIRGRVEYSEAIAIDRMTGKASYFATHGYKEAKFTSSGRGHCAKSQGSKF